MQSYVVHVVDVCPHSVQWNLQAENRTKRSIKTLPVLLFKAMHLIRSVVVHHSLDCVDVGVAKAALVEAEPPVWWHLWPANDLLVLLDHRLRTGTQEEIEVENA